MIPFTGVVQLVDYFEHYGPHGKHVCMVFETMGPNVLALIKRFNFKGVPLNIVRKVAGHTLIGLDYLHRICGIIHTDLKPENVLVACPKGVPVNKHGTPLIGPVQQTESSKRDPAAQRMEDLAKLNKAKKARKKKGKGDKKAGKDQDSALTPGGKEADGAGEDEKDQDPEGEAKDLGDLEDSALAAGDDDDADEVEQEDAAAPELEPP